MLTKFLLSAWILAAVLLFLYSFTQVDLSLTFSRASFLQDIQKSFQYVGYFNRPLSTYLYGALILLLFGLYITMLYFIKKSRVSRKTLWILILSVSAILFLSYNAFSYDLFNYIFDAKIITHYGENPYAHKALDYPGDPMLSFMRWTHRVYPYGPVWLGLTVPLSFIGFGYFIVTFYLFKLLMLGSFLGSLYIIEKIAKKTSIIDPLFAIAFFGLSPLVLIESLISAHHDIVMMFVALLGFYYLLNKKYLFALVFLALSIGVKFATLFLIPAYLLFFLSGRIKRYNYQALFLLAAVGMVVGVTLAAYRTNFQPWYLLFALPFITFVADRKYVFVPSVIISFFALLQYIPYLFTGNWNPPIPSILSTMLLTSLGISGLYVLVLYVMQKLWKHKISCSISIFL